MKMFTTIALRHLLQRITVNGAGVQSSSLFCCQRRLPVVSLHISAFCQTSRLQLRSLLQLQQYAAAAAAGKDADSRRVVQ